MRALYDFFTTDLITFQIDVALWVASTASKDGQPFEASSRGYDSLGGHQGASWAGLDLRVRAVTPNRARSV